MRLSFSNDTVRNIFAETDYNDFSRLMFDTARGEEKVSKEEANGKIREIMFSILGVDEKASRKTLRQAIRRHKNDIFEVIENTVEDLLVSGWGDNPFFNEFVEIRSAADGDTNSFYTEDEVILTVSELSGNHHDLIRQRLGEGKSFSVKTSWYGVKIYTEYELFMAGRVDWAGFVQKIYEAVDKHLNDMLYASVMSAGDQVVPSSQFVKTGAIDEAHRDELMTLIEDVQMATGDEVVIMGTKSALSRLNKLVETNWISNDMKNERHTTGRLGMWDGIRLVEIPQRFADNDTTVKLVDNKKLLIMPVADNRFVKVFNEGDAQFKEVSDGTTNMDKTIEYEYQFKMGVATIIGKKFGMWTITD